MGKKNKHDKKAKGKAVEVELTKKERKALKAREAELAAKLEAKGKKDKGGKKPKAKLDKLADLGADEEELERQEAIEPDPVRIAFLEAIIADLENNSQDTRDKAKRNLAKVLAGKPEGIAGDARLVDDAEVTVEVVESDAETAAIKAQVKAKKEARKLGLDPDSVDRNDEAAVTAFNAKLAEAGGTLNLLTSTAEVKRRAADLEPDDKPKRKAKPDEVVVELNTEEGREFVAGAAKDEPEAETFATVEDNKPIVERDHFGRPKIFNPATGKAKAYTRVTTYIDNLEDKSALEKWKLRTMLEGLVLNEAAVGDSEGPSVEYHVGQARDAMHTRDVALAKLNKADRKGKLEVGERGQKADAIVKAFKSTLDAIAREALDVGGVHERAQKGTDLHALCELYDMQGMAAVSAKLEAEEITPADHADVVAYASAMLAAGIKVLECEQLVVNDEDGIAGTLDRLVMAKLPGGTRAMRMVGDIKTGRVDYGVGKIAQQIGQYAKGKGYDPADPKARRDLKANQTKGLLIHLPQGEATCKIYVVDLTLGAKGNKLSSEVRAWRNEGKRAIDFKVDLAAEVMAK